MKTDPRENRIDYVEFPTASLASHAATKKFYGDVFGWSYQAWGDDYSDTKDSGIASGINGSSEHQAAKPLVGQHDFHSFETEWPNRASSVRTITHLAVNRCGAYLWLDVEADGFLYNMVRAIAGTLINVGRGYWPVEEETNECCQHCTHA